VVKIIISGRLWRNELGSAVVLGLCGIEVWAGMVWLLIDIVIMAIDEIDSWGSRGNPGRDFLYNHQVMVSQ